MKSGCTIRFSKELFSLGIRDKDNEIVERHCTETIKAILNFLREKQGKEDWLSKVNDNSTIDVKLLVSDREPQYKDPEDNLKLFQYGTLVDVNKKEYKIYTEIEEEYATH